MRILTVEEYNPEWANKYEREAGQIRLIFSQKLSEIHHIGSTAVRGMSAKPTIDILGVLESLEYADIFTPELEALGYKAYGEYGVSGRRFFVKVHFINSEDWVNAFHLHFFQKGDSKNIRRHIAVREYLSSHPEKAQDYSTVKTGLARRYPRDQEKYVSGKEEYVSILEKEALEWFGRTGEQAQ